MWLGYDPLVFKKQEIGSHRKYSSRGKNGATADTFRREMETVFRWLSRHVKPTGFVCFVVGDSTIRGETVKNDELVVDVASGFGFSLQARIDRQIQATRKAFNPAIGKIKTEKIVILQNVGRT